MINQLPGIGLGGPVGFSLAGAGFCCAIIVARVWEYVSLESYINCSPSCPVRSVDPFQLHHSYYGLGLLLVTVSLLSFAKSQRVRWDLALIFGIGAGLAVDETGLLLLRVPYDSLLSTLVIVSAGLIILAATINAAVRDGTREYKLLDHADTLTILSILLGMAGFLYLDRPLVMIVEISGGLSWAFASVLGATYARKHFRKFWIQPG